MELGELIRKTVGDESCPATEYVDGDADAPSLWLKHGKKISYRA